MRAEGFVLQPTYRLRGGAPVVLLYGKLADGRPFVVEERRFRPYFFTHVESVPALAGAAVEIEACDLCDLEGRPVARVVARQPGDVPELRRRLEGAGGMALEADVRFAYRFLIDRGIRASLSIEGEPSAAGPSEAEGSGLLRFRDPELGPAEHRPSLRLLSLDIETSPDASRVYSVALMGAGIDEVHLVLARPPGGAGVQAHADEGALLRAVARSIRQADPDVLTGWNVVDFDLRVLSARAQSLGIPFVIGRDAGPIRFERDRGFTRESRAEVPGRVVLDGVTLVRDAFIVLDDYRLDTAARALLGRGKLIEAEGMDRAQEITRLYRRDPSALVEYNREDARLVLEIVEREALLELAIERSLLCGMQLDRVGASIASFDRVYLPELRRRGAVAPSVDPARKLSHVRGGAVLESHPGFFSNVAVFDFKSLYPSLIRTFNLDPLAHARARGVPPAEVIEAPNGARFSRREAILPEVLEGYFARREQARLRGDRHGDLAIKIMMNALFGVLGAAGCRFFDPEVANAITGFGQLLLGWTREAFEVEGFRVLYGDTDSVFVALDPRAPGEQALAQAAMLRERVQDRISERVRAAYGVEPRLVLELECLYARFFQPRLRRAAQGSKKRYAGLVEDEVRVVGLESIRRDSPAIAKRLQQGMLARAFSDRPVAPFVREVVERVLRGELDLELVVRKGVRKGSLDRYTATTPPHVKAARKAAVEAPGSVGRVVRYVVTESGPEPVLPGQPLPARIDRRYYVEKVLRPLAESILEARGESFEAALGEPRQLNLL